MALLHWRTRIQDMRNISIYLYVSEAEDPGMALGAEAAAATPEAKVAGDGHELAAPPQDTPADIVDAAAAKPAAEVALEAATAGATPAATTGEVERQASEGTPQEEAKPAQAEALALPKVAAPTAPLPAPAAPELPEAAAPTAKAGPPAKAAMAGAKSPPLAKKATG